ncbi:hypothetical protein [Nitrosopumilus piranensis]|uniref:Uncharacterized protein n=1 Tax=Nitrosopumilus piranensis TaxID=1582439 RepID=A0A0C5BT40_9ARCH|nr:hypothetical protein [Nitrosopumilus piranensis]AJM92918.1 conserved exported protein of unknown function [Nitrosopumilus piranensis]
MVVAGVVILVSVALIFTNTAYAQIADEQVTLSGDLENNPVAQDILEKIEKSKKWIAKLQERNFEASERQRELEEKRAEVLEHLNADLKKWDDLWGYYTFDKMLERALKDSLAKDTDTIYDHPLKFTASKINAGRAALAQVIENGGGPEEARDAFANAAKITQAEMITANALFNVLSGNAYYNQQILFESDGQFNLDLSGEQLRKYYLDYRTNPGYLSANPKDTLSWEDLSETNPSTQCRDEYLLIYRNHADDYVCVTEYTAEMWQRHGMGIPIHKEKYSVPDELTRVQLNQDRIGEKVSAINLKIQKIHDNYEAQVQNMEKKYAHMFVQMEQQQKDEEKTVLNKLNSDEIDAENFSAQIIDIREKYNEVEKNMIKEKFQVLDIMEKSMKENLDTLISKYDHDSEIKIVWNDKQNTYNATIDV